MTIEINTIGMVAGFLTTVSYFPQVLKVWKTKSAKDLSYISMLMLASGLGLWLAYGIQTSSMPLVWANGFTLGLVSSVALMKFHFHREPDAGSAGACSGKYSTKGVVD